MEIMTQSIIAKYIFTWLTKGQRLHGNDAHYNDLANKLADLIHPLSKKERHAVYMALKAVK